MATFANISVSHAKHTVSPSHGAQFPLQPDSTQWVRTRLRVVKCIDLNFWKRWAREPLSINKIRVQCQTTEFYFPIDVSQEKQKHNCPKKEKSFLLRQNADNAIAHIWSKTSLPPVE